MRLSVVIASYNRIATIHQAIASVFEQDLPVGLELKVIVVDDGGTDGTYQSVCERWGLKEIRPGAEANQGDLTLLRVPNGERGLARNIGARWALEHFQTEWFLFLDSDDVLTATSLLRFAQTPIHAETVLLYSWCVSWDGKTSPAQRPGQLRFLPSGDVARAVLSDTFIPLGGTLIRAQSFLAVGEFPEPRELAGSEDKILLSRLCFHGPVQFVPQVAVWYRQHEGSTPLAPMLASIDKMEHALENDIRARFPRSPGLHLGLFRRAGALKKIGHSIYLKRLSSALQLMLKEVVARPYSSLDPQLWLMGVRIVVRGLRPRN